jgi:hypothetical protein
MTYLTRFLLAAALFLCTTPAFAQTSAAGMWRVEFVTQTGQSVVMMTINQSGTKLTGHIADEYGEYEISGRLADGEVTVVWSVPEDGKMLEITMKGKLEGALITGTAKLGNVGEGPLTARRTGDAGDVAVR